MHAGACVCVRACVCARACLYVCLCAAKTFRRSFFKTASRRIVACSFIKARRGSDVCQVEAGVSQRISWWNANTPASSFADEVEPRRFSMYSSTWKAFCNGEELAVRFGGVNGSYHADCPIHVGRVSTTLHLFRVHPELNEVFERRRLELVAYNGPHHSSPTCSLSSRCLAIHPSGSPNDLVTPMCDPDPDALNRWMRKPVDQSGLITFTIRWNGLAKAVARALPRACDMHPCAHTSKHARVHGCPRRWNASKCRERGELAIGRMYLDLLDSDVINEPSRVASSLRVSATACRQYSKIRAWEVLNLTRNLATISLTKAILERAWYQARAVLLTRDGRVLATSCLLFSNIHY